MKFKDTVFYAAGAWIVQHFIMLITFIYKVIKAAIIKVVSIFDDNSAAGAPWSLRRWMAVFFAWAFYKALTGVIAALAAPTPPSVPVIAIVLGAPLLGVIFMLFFTTWESVRGLINAARGTPDAGPTATTADNTAESGGK